MNTFETKKIDQETIYYDENNEKIDEKEFKEKYWREDYKNTFSDNIFYWIIIIWIIFFIYFIISFFLPKSIDIEWIRQKVFTEKLENRKLYLEEWKAWLKKMELNEACLTANERPWTLSDCLSLDINN